MARTNRPDEAYHIPTLNKWFAFSSFVLLLTFVWLIWADYDRSWKNHQREFRELEIASLEHEKSIAAARLDEDEVKEKLAAQESALAAATEALSSKQAELNALDAEIHQVQQRHFAAKTDYNFANATLGDAKYNTEHDLAHYADDPTHAAELIKDYQVEVAKVDKLKNLYLDQDDALQDLEAKKAQLLSDQTKAEGGIALINKEVRDLKKRIDDIGHNLFNDVFRDAPVLDFIAPSIKIKQAVIPTLRDDYNFATVQKEDRCHTCHLGIDQRKYELHPATGRFLDASTRAAYEGSVWAGVRDYIQANVPKADQEDVSDSFSEDYVGLAETDLTAWADEAFEDYDEISGETLFAAISSPREELRLRTITYGAHPNLDLYLTSASPHPLETVGCTVCHEGKGHAVEFNRVFHTPKDKEQEAQWHADYGWHEPHYWDWPQLPADRVSASCAKCHDNDDKVVGGEAFNRGKQLVADYGCYGCHRIEGMTGELRQAGPALTKVASKISPEFAYGWIWNPAAFRPSSKMPRFFDQSNNGADASPEFLARTKQEARGLVSYLYQHTDPYESPTAPHAGDPVAGEKLFQEVGCLGCHSMADKGQSVNNHGPDLSGIGSKLSKDWIYGWVRNPRKYFSKTHMPSLRLSEVEASDVAAYLAGLKKDGWTDPAMPARNTELQMQIVREMLASSMRRSDLEAKLKALSPDELEVLLGERAIGKYGCTGCHEIKGFEGAGPIGTELTTWGSKFTTQLDFGNLGHELDHNHIAWATNKLKNPRIYDRGKENTKHFDELLKMPNFGFTDAQIDDLVTYLMSRTKRQLADSVKRPMTPDHTAVQEGMQVVREYNCYGCHYFNGEGGNFAQYWKLDSSGKAKFVSAEGSPVFDYLEDVEGPVRGHVPPVLLDQGNKTNPPWLFSFLKNPSMLRPQLKMRMPTFQFDDEETNKLLKMFAGLEGHGIGEETSYEPDPELAVIGRQLFENGKCVRCHMFTDSEVAPDQVPKGVVAPNLKLATSRLQHTWTPRWLADPQTIMPGANMPNYFDLETGYTALDPDKTLLGGDVQKGMDALRDYLELSGRSYDSKSAKTASATRR